MNYLQWDRYPNLRKLSIGSGTNTHGYGSVNIFQSQISFVSKGWYCDKFTELSSFAPEYESDVISSDYVTEINLFSSDCSALISSSPNIEYLEDYKGTNLIVRSIQDGYVYLLSSAANIKFGDFNSIQFDGNNNPNASFLLDFGDYYEFDQGLPNISYINGAKKENVFVKAHNTISQD
jgi:hypothetical protein